jgi:hypothetical protein
VENEEKEGWRERKASSLATVERRGKSKTCYRRRLNRETREYQEKTEERGNCRKKRRKRQGRRKSFFASRARPDSA